MYKHIIDSSMKKIIKRSTALTYFILPQHQINIAEVLALESK